MINREIFTESPEDDLWRELLQYSYRANVSRYLKEHSLDEDEDTINTIIGSFLQANEYFKASKSANLQISPLLLYYGATNLLLGLTSLMTGKRPEIKNHGMTAIDSTISTYIAEANVVFGDPNTGGIHQFARILGFEKDLTKCGEWKMMDFLSSIVEIDQDYRKCYAQENGNTLLLDLFNTPTGTIERLYLNKNKVEAISAVLNNVEGFEKKDIDKSRYSLSTKAADALASGVLILAYGDADCGIIEYMKQTGAAVVCDNKQELGSMIRSILADGIRQKAYYVRQIAVTADHHSLRKSCETAESVIDNAVGSK